MLFAEVPAVVRAAEAAGDLGDLGEGRGARGERWVTPLLAVFGQVVRLDCHWGTDL